MDHHSTSVPFALLAELAALHGVSPSDGKHVLKSAIEYKRNGGVETMTEQRLWEITAKFYKGKDRA